MSPSLILLLACACGLAVANLYYAQPLLGLIAASLGVSEVKAAMVVTCTQLGYAAGLILLVPLGDLWENRRLITVVLLVSLGALLAVALAPSIDLLLLLAVGLGASCVVAQMLVPLAAHLAPPEKRGQVVGQVMSGLLLGILLARFAAGVVSQQVGWRGVYLGSAVLMALLIGALRLRLPRRQPPPGPGYRELLLSLGAIWKAQPVLRWRAGYQFLMFAAFSLFWSAVTFLLTERPFNFSQANLGSFALLGVVGALLAPVAGNLADAGRGRSVTLGALLLGSASFALTLLPDSLAAVALGAVGLDMAVQTTMVVGQGAIYALNPDQHSRINTLYISTFFLGGALGSSLAGVLYATWGWPGVAALGTALPLPGLLLWLTEPGSARAAR